MNPAVPVTKIFMYGFGCCFVFYPVDVVKWGLYIFFLFCCLANMLFCILSVRTPDEQMGLVFKKVFHLIVC